MNHKFLIVSILFFLLRPVLLPAQCMVVPAFPGCSPAGSVSLVDGASIGVGQIHTFSGTSTYGGLTLNGGTLIVCGNLTLNALTMNSGTIIVNAGATFTVFNGGATIPFGANSNIYNYGNTIFRVSIVTGANNVLMNCLPSSSFTVPFNQLVIQGPNTFFINNGSVQSSFFIVQSNNSPNCICMGNGSTIVTATFINQFLNAFNTPVGASCINVTQNVINPNQVTNTPAVNVCIPSGINIVSGPNWGSATVSPNCTSCSVPLPVELLFFDGHSAGTRNVLNWSTISETNNCHFLLERSTDCVVFENIELIEGGMNSNSLLNYESIDPNIDANVFYYYRIKQVNCDGVSTFSTIVSLISSEPSNEWVLWPNPAEDVLHIYTPSHAKQNVSIYNTSGQVVKNEITDNDIDITDISSGVYYVEISIPNKESIVRKLLKH